MSPDRGWRAKVACWWWHRTEWDFALFRNEQGYITGFNFHCPECDTYHKPSLFTRLWVWWNGGIEGSR